MPITSTYPATGETWRTYEELSAAELEAKLQLAVHAFHDHRQSTFLERAKKLAHAATLLEEQCEELARLAVSEMGKPIQAARDEVRKCARCCRYYADNGAHLLAEEEVQTEAGRSYVTFQPLGPVLAVMPWNFPYWQVFRFAAPALMAGNVGLLKHASNVPAVALAMERIFIHAGFPRGCFQNLLISAQRAEALLDDHRIVAATLTGSEGAGSKIAAAAGRNIKKTVLELGGSDPFIVMPSADQDKAVATAVQARLLNNGQSCIAAKRFIVHEAVYPAFRDEFVRRMQALKIGDPMDESTQLGPLATAAIRDDLHDQVQRAVQDGARLLCGGEPLSGPGFFYEPTVLEEVPAKSKVFHEETFGPVAMLFQVSSAHEAIELANATAFGLGASVWTNDASEIEHFTHGVEAGSVFVNALVASDPRLPFGGIKISGYGRELSGYGIREFTNIKTVWVA